MNSELQLTSALRAAIDEVLPPAPWLESQVFEDFRKRVETGRAAPRARKRVGVWNMRLAAAFVIVVLAVGAIAAFLGIHSLFSPVPARHVGFEVIPGGTGVCNSLDYPPGRMGAGAAAACAMDWPLFVSPQVGWVTEDTVLFRTDDGGRHWREQYTWTGGGGPDVVRASADGREAVATGSDKQGRLVLFRTVDSGEDWQVEPIPASAGRAKQSDCKGGTCNDQVLEPSIDLISPRVGWLTSQEPGYNTVDLFLTSDAGAHWKQTARVDVKTQFGLDPATGTPSPKKGIDHGLGGQFVFQTSTSGWFISSFSAPASLFGTVDGGLTWRKQSLPVPAHHDPSQISINYLKALSSTDAVVDLTYGSSESADHYISATSDGGATWTDPVQSPDATVYYLDAKQWMAWPHSGGWMRTADGGRHWEQLPSNTLPVSPFGAPGAEFIDPLHGWAIAYADQGGFALYQTSDGAVTWAPVDLPQVQPST